MNSNVELTDMSILVLGSLSNTIQARLMSFVVTMTEIKPSNVHTSIDQLLEGGNVPTGRAHGADDLGFTGGYIGGFCDTLESNVGAAEFGA